MATLADLQHQPAPTSINIDEPRMTGTLALAYTRSSRFAPVIRFGTPSFTAEPNLIINRIPYSVAGVTAEHMNQQWTIRIGPRMRRRDRNSWDDHHPTDAAHQRFTTWARTVAGRLAKQHPDAFTPDLGSSDSWINLAASFDRAANLCRIHADTVDQLRQPDITFEPVTTGKQIRWVDHRYLADINRHRQPAAVVAVAKHGNNIIAYLVDPADGSHGSTGTPVVIPAELMEAP